MEFPLPSLMLEFLILGFLEKKDSYGYEISQTIKTVQEIREPVLYPILKKLQKEESISSYEEIHSGRRRKYYRLTPGGQERLKRLKADWELYKKGIDGIVDNPAEQL